MSKHRKECPETGNPTPPQKDEELQAIVNEIKKDKKDKKEKQKKEKSK